MLLFGHLGEEVEGGGWRGRTISFHSSVRRDPLGTPRGGPHSLLPLIENRDSSVQIAKQIAVITQCVPVP